MSDDSEMGDNRSKAFADWWHKVAYRLECDERMGVAAEAFRAGYRAAITAQPTPVRGVLIPLPSTAAGVRSIAIADITLLSMLEELTLLRERVGELQGHNTKLVEERRAAGDSDAVVQAFAEGASAGGKQGHAEERAQIVKWLRDSRHLIAEGLGLDIEDGTHWKWSGKAPF